MTPGQTRVLVLILATLGLEAVFSPDVKGLLQGKIPNVAGIGSALIIDAVAVLLLIALAAIASGLATFFAVLLLVGVLLAHSTPIAGLINGATNANKTLAHVGS